VERLVRRTAHALGRDFARQGVGAIRARNERVGLVAHARLAAVDDRRIGEADRDVVAGRPEFLEEARFADPQE
jgi:hypothetical protein